MNENTDSGGKTTRYRSFILRLWRNDPALAIGWQASLHDALTGRSYGFAGLEELFAFLMDLDTSLDQAMAEGPVIPIEHSGHANGSHSCADGEKSNGRCPI